MKYVVDEIIDNYAKLENIETGEILEIKLDELPEDIKEQNVLVKEENSFYIDNLEEEKRRENILERFNKLKGN